MNFRSQQMQMGIGIFLAVALSFTSASRGQGVEQKEGASGGQRPRGSTMRITQEIDLGDLSCSTDYRTYFLPPNKFRIEGTMYLKAMEMKIRMVIVGNGPLVKQLSETPLGPRALTVDLDRIRKAIPEYSPSRTYDPTVYKKLLDSTPDKKPLPAAEMDGVAVEGYELSLPEGRLSLPSNVSLGLPDPARIRIWVNPKDGIARKVELEDVRGNVFLKMRYTDVRTGVAISSEKFVLEFPDGVTPTDVTDLILGGVAATRQPPTEKNENGDRYHFLESPRDGK